VAVAVERYVGRALPRVEDLRLLTGQGRYAADFDRDGQLYASIVRSDLGHGRIRAIDAAAATAREGVVRVFTSVDLPDVRIPIRLFGTDRAARALQPPLARGRVRYVGDPVAVVVARDPYVAEDGASEVLVDVEPLEPVLDPVAAAEDAFPPLHEELGSNVVDRLSTKKGMGVATLFENAAVVVKETFHVHRHGAVPMEPRGLLAEFDASVPRLTVWGAAKVKHYNRRILSGLLDLPVEQIRFVEGDVGGAFGARGEFYPEDFLIPWLAVELGRSVKWVEDRRENLIALNHSREQDWKLEMAADADGRLVAFRAKGVFNQGGYVRTHGGTLLPRLMINHVPGPYRWDAYEIDTASVLTNKTPAGTYRGPGQYEPTFIRERTVDLVARELGMDPAELRRRNLVTPDEIPYETGLPDVDDPAKSIFYKEGDFPQTFDTVLEHVGYDALRADVSARQAEGELVGLGVTAFIEMGNPGVFEQARVVPDADGKFTAHVGIASVGQGVETVLSQVAADQLGVPMERVRISYRDTDVVPEGQGAFSSRATVWGGHAIAGAIRDLEEQARAVVAERTGVSRDEVGFAAGCARFTTDGEPGEIPLAELGVEGKYRYEPDEASHTLMGANVGLVELDGDSGQVKLRQYAISYEVGRAINPLTLRGQVRGAAVQGLGGALFEEFAYAADGQPLSTSFMDYAMPTAAELPDIDVLLLELGESTADSPLEGAKGGGEGGIIATAATVANAVADALGDAGRELTRLPITPETVARLAAAGPERGKVEGSIS
jgi:carbon-monoxide dehydrogenase large subunit